jgi:hypothetical protein
MKPNRRGLTAIAVLAAASSGLALAPFASVATAASGFCAGQAYSGTTITWTGKGDGHSWSKAANWSPSKVPDAGQTPATYQTQYVCIGDNKGGKSATVTIAGNQAFHVAGIDIRQGATLTIKHGGRLFLGSKVGSAVVASTVEKHSQLQLDAATLGGNSPLTIKGTFRWTGQKISGHKEVATLTSSECVFDPSISACPGGTAPGGGKTIIASGGSMLVDGVGFGGADLTDRRVIHNFGTITLTGFGFIAMSNGTQLVDEPHSSLRLDGFGGIYRGTKTGAAAPVIEQLGKVVRDAGGNNVAVLGVPVVFGKGKPNVSILRGALVLNAKKAPKAAVRRNSGYGIGSCVVVKLFLCKQPVATSAAPQVALVRTSAETGSPTVSKITVALGKTLAKIHGHRVLGQAINVTAPTEKTTHSTHLTFVYDVTTAGLKSSTKPIVYRGTHAITLCRVHGLTAKNTSCVFSESVAHSGSAPFAGGKQTKGDLTIVVITIQPNARWISAA